MTQPKTKYVTRKKRLRQLEKQNQQLKERIHDLVLLLDQVNGILLRRCPDLARSVERSMHESIESSDLLPSEMPLELMRKKPQRCKIRNPSIAPRSDLVITRVPGGRIATPRPPKA